MFRKTRLRLVFINSIVFFCLLLIFGAVLYFFTEYRLYSQEDETLIATAQQIKQGDDDNIDEHTRSNPSGDPYYDDPDEIDEDRQSHIVYVLPDATGKLLRQLPNTLSTGALAQLPAQTPTDRASTIRLNGAAFRLYTIQVPAGLVSQGNSSVREIQLLYNREDDEAMLGSLRTVIEISTIICAALAVAAGLYLANRALIPIQKSWNKQQQFVADASHELRTPLTVLQMHLERLFRHPSHTIEQEVESILRLVKETTRMRRLVSDLLTLARGDSNQVQLMMKPVRLDVVIDVIIEQFRDLAMMKGIDIKVSTTTPVTIRADEERIQQLLTILLDNAVKFTGHGGSIEVNWSVVGNAVHLAVSDNGIGVSEEDLPKLFDRFFQANKARSNGGTGLGLAMEAMGPYWRMYR
ncbi:HAMP domain-containing histidine kinase [Alicyclobacillus fastidiosus]|uniref:histidine kinase n=1 Tax=Alicyclobacillus fastidiosus TaxID=392011 RepID=A0ABY6ZEK6_9BACL|nr:HAMP domain-containing sensor histidine kinase [Alicyclobacillus fastidiosus]WAH41325.1 HAMP domain-containing histidine kinase [Alicyclobacillus fastidiosus]GMA62934.1 two-component sensor histidine kinase [Alicyclobacillus fastidiosus]